LIFDNPNQAERGTYFCSFQRIGRNVKRSGRRLTLKSADISVYLHPVQCLNLNLFRHNLKSCATANNLDIISEMGALNLLKIIFALPVGVLFLYMKLQSQPHTSQVSKLGKSFGQGVFNE